MWMHGRSVPGAEVQALSALSLLIAVGVAQARLLSRSLKSSRAYLPVPPYLRPQVVHYSKCQGRTRAPEPHQPQCVSREPR